MTRLSGDHKIPQGPEDPGDHILPRYLEALEALEAPEAPEAREAPAYLENLAYPEVQEGPCLPGDPFHQPDPFRRQDLEDLLLRESHCQEKKKVEHSHTATHFCDLAKMRYDVET